MLAKLSYDADRQRIRVAEEVNVATKKTFFDVISIYEKVLHTSKIIRNDQFENTTYRMHNVTSSLEFPQNIERRRSFVCSYTDFLIFICLFLYVVFAQIIAL